MSSAADAALVVGLIGVAIAILERGYKKYQDQKATDPDLKFNFSYLINMLVSSGIGSVLATTIIPTLISQLPDSTIEQAVTPLFIIINFLLGYATTFRVLDGMNNSTAKKIELSQATTPTTTRPSKTSPS